MKRLNNQTVIVTGGAAGIGAACVQKMLAEGAKVLVIDRDGEMLEKRKCDFVNFGSSFKLLNIDISTEKARCAAIETAVEWAGSCDIIINNAAAFVMKGIDATVEEWHEVLNTNLIACAQLGHFMAKKAQFSNRNRAIVNLCSISATHAQPQFATYNASKGALLTLTKCMALDLAPLGIRVNGVSPGTIWTESNAGHIMRRFGIDRQGADGHPELGGKHVLQRLGDTHEVANAVCFLASSEASFITGANLMVDGGYSIL